MKILVGLSGGVDSAYTAMLLKEQGHEPEGAVLIMSDHTELSAARETARSCGIKLHEIDCRENFRKYVIDNFIEEYSSGRTPNPCVMCNRYVKIDALCEYAEQHGFDKVATGHYSKIEFDRRYFVRRAGDKKKDQSYMLWRLTQRQLSMLVTPLSRISKSEVVADCRRLGLRAAEREESQEICFIPDRDYASYIEGIKGKFPEGDFIDENGNAVGRHKGIIHYTVGQRKGLGLSVGKPVFVTAIDAENNLVRVSEGGGEYGKRLELKDLNFQYFEAPEDRKTAELDIKIRYAAAPVTAHVEYDAHSAAVEFDGGARAITPGQSAVLYCGDKVAFGGIIK